MRQAAMMPLCLLPALYLSCRAQRLMFVALFPHCARKDACVTPRCKEADMRQEALRG